MSKPRKQIHLGAHFPGVNNTTVWSDPTSGSQIELDSFIHLARTAERGLFDLFFLAEGLRLREHRGRIFDLDVVGRPDAITVLSALAGVTEHLGLAGTCSTTYNEPYELARQFASLDFLSGGRAAWNAVTSPDAFTGQNFRRGGFLPDAVRYERAAEFIELTRAFWDSWADGAVVADAAGGTFTRPGSIRPVQRRTAHFDVDARATLPRCPQGWPVQIQAGDSDGGRDLGAAYADVIFSRHAGYDDGRAYFADVKGRMARFGRHPDQLKIMPAATVVLGDSEDDAREKARHIRLQQVSPQGAIAFLEQTWGRDLSGYDPDGPLPDVDPDEEGRATITQGRVRQQGGNTVAQRWRAMAEAENLSIRELIIKVTSRTTFCGTPAQVAAQIDRNVQDDAADGYILVPHLTPHGLDEFVDKVIPELQDRGSYRTAWEGPTLRDQLGVDHPHLPSRSLAATAAD